MTGTAASANCVTMRLGWNQGGGMKEYNKKKQLVKQSRMSEATLHAFVISYLAVLFIGFFVGMWCFY